MVTKTENITMLKPYWIVEEPIDLEYKYYILMGYLVRLKEHFNKKGFERYFKELLILRRDLLSFLNGHELSQRSLVNMTNNEKEEFYKLMDDNTENFKDIDAITQNSLKIIDTFLKEHNKTQKKYNALADVECYSSSSDLWDQGFLVIRKSNEKFMKIFNWFFSTIKIGEKENLALLMTELLDPTCPTTNEIKEIRGFLKKNVKDLSNNNICVLVGDVSKDIGLEIGVEICKEKSIEIIMTRFKNTI